MNRLLVCPLLAAGLLVITSLAAAAPSTVTATAVAADSSTPASSVAAKAKPSTDRFCLHQTGTHIVARDRAGQHDQRCIAGRVYGRQDIERTGATGMADALRKLDPAIH